MLETLPERPSTADELGIMLNRELGVPDLGTNDDSDAPTLVDRLMDEHDLITVWALGSPEYPEYDNVLLEPHDLGNISVQHWLFESHVKRVIGSTWLDVWIAFDQLYRFATANQPDDWQLQNHIFIEDISFHPERKIVLVQTGS